MKKVACIFTNGDLKDESYYKNIVSNCGIIISADGASNALFKMGLSPDYLVGDMDSIEDKVLSYFKEEGKEVIIFPREKNQTDTEIAIDFAKDRGFKEVILLGALGNRIDHTLGNIGLLFYGREKSIEITIMDSKNKMYLLKEGGNILKTNKDQIVSFIAFAGDVKGITLKGFKYPLIDYDLQVGSSRCISNIAVSKEPSVEVKKGFLIAIESMD